MKRKFTAPTRPRISSGVRSCTSDVPDHHAHGVGRAHHHQRRQRQRACCATARRRASARPKTTTACSIRIPTRRVMLRRASTAVIASAPTAGAARSTPRPQGPVWRMSRGVDRHQRRRPAEQHREEVERDRPEDRLVAAHEADAGEEIAEPRLRPIAGRRLQPDRAVEDAADQPEGRHDRVGHRRPRGIGEAAERRAGDHRHLEHAGRERRRPLELPLRRHAGQERRRRRRLEGGGDPEERDRGIDRRDRQPALPAPPAEERRRRSACTIWQTCTTRWRS